MDGVPGKSISFVFNPETPITWAPVEAHWQIYIRIEEVSSKASPEPTAKTNGQIEFIADRTAPAAVLTAPAVSSQLRGGETYTIAWQVSDPHLP